MNPADALGSPSSSAPTRRALRAALTPLARPSTGLALAWLSFDVLVWVALTAFTASAAAWGWRLK